MQGVHAFEPTAKVAIDLESFVANDHFLRRVDQVLDLSFVRELTAGRYVSGKGRPSIDPEVFFRMLILAFLYGIASDRRLCEDVRDNLAYRWFYRLSLTDEVPDHSSFTRIRDRYGEEIFHVVFRRIVELCQKKGLVKKECRVMTDATQILRWIPWCTPIQKKLARSPKQCSDVPNAWSVRPAARSPTRPTLARPILMRRWRRSGVRHDN